MPATPNRLHWIRLVAALVSLGVLAGACGDDDAEPSTTTSPRTEQDSAAPTDATDTTEASAASTTPTPVQVTIPPPGDTIIGPTPCPPEDGASERVTVFEEPPPLCIDTSKRYTAEVTTTKGSFVIELDTEMSPLTVNNFVVLARYRYFDGIAFHRIVTNFVAQAGDATGPVPGVGGPGYRFDDELPPVDFSYEPGVVAMANAGANTQGSQFFIMLSNSTGLPPLYTVLGRVIEGLDAVTDIGAAGSPDGAGAPTEVVVITRIDIVESG